MALPSAREFLEQDDAQAAAPSASAFLAQDDARPSASAFLAEPDAGPGPIRQAFNRLIEPFPALAVPSLTARKQVKRW